MGSQHQQQQQQQQKKSSSDSHDKSHFADTHHSSASHAAASAPAAASASVSRASHDSASASSSKNSAATSSASSSASSAAAATSSASAANPASTTQSHSPTVDEELEALGEYTFSSFGFTPEQASANPSATLEAVAKAASGLPMDQHDPNRAQQHPVNQHADDREAQHAAGVLDYAPGFGPGQRPPTESQGPRHSHVDSPQRRTISGVVQLKQWSKSEESFRAGGSEYFTIDLSDSGEGEVREPLILRIDPAVPPEPYGISNAATAAERVAAVERALKTMAAGQINVEIEGQDRSETLTVDTSEMDPHPLGFEDSITTHTFLVRRIVKPAPPQPASPPRPPGPRDLTVAAAGSGSGLGGLRGLD